MEIDFERLFEIQNLKGEVINIIQKALNLIIEDHSEACSLFSKQKDKDLEEFCAFEVEINIFLNLITALLSGDLDFLSVLCPFAHELESIFIIFS